MPSVVPPARPRRAHTAMRPTVFYRPMPRPAHGGAPPCVPRDDDERHDCGRDDGARDEGSSFWRFLRAVLEPVAMR